MTSEAVCIIPNCNRGAPASEPFCSHHRDFPQPRSRRGQAPCGECHLRAGETCDICGAALSTGGPDGR